MNKKITLTLIAFFIDIIFYPESASAGLKSLLNRLLRRHNTIVQAIKMPSPTQPCPATHSSRHRSMTHHNVSRSKLCESHVFANEDICNDMITEGSRLNFEQCLSLFCYTNGQYREINSYLRKEVANEHQEEHKISDEISLALNQLPNHSGWLQRGADMSKEALEKYNPGSQITEPAFLSTSELENTKPEVIPQVNLSLGTGYEQKPVQFLIYSQCGKKISNFSGEADEKEVLINKSSRFRVRTKTCTTPLSCTIVMEQICP